MSVPMILNLGVRSPATRRNGSGVPRSKCQSPALADAARTLTNTSPSRSVGSGTSARCSTSGGPYVARTMAFMLLPHHVWFSPHQEPGKSTGGADVIRQTPCRPPGGDAGVCDDVAVDGVLNAMGREPTNDDPWTCLESGNGRDHEQSHDDRFEEHGFNRADHRRKQHVVRRNHDQDGGIEGSIAI